MLSKNPSFRAFFAIEIPKNIQATIATTIKPLQTDPNLQQIKWVEPQNWHITLCFLGNISAQQQQCIDQKIKIAVVSINNFQLELTKLQPFPSAAKFHSISLEPKPYVKLVTLALTIERIVKSCDIQIKNRPFMPHFTLGRIKNQNTTQLQSLNNIKLPTMSFAVTAIKLFKSEPGSIYTVINSYDLKP